MAVSEEAPWLLALATYKAEWGLHTVRRDVLTIEGPVFVNEGDPMDDVGVLRSSTGSTDMLLHHYHATLASWHTLGLLPAPRSSC